MVLVVFIIALASILVTNLTYSTFLESRSVGMVQRQLQAEYLLKSMVNFAASLLSKDSSSRVDGIQDPWGYFLDGREVPPELLSLLGVPTGGVRVFLQIRPENMKMPLDILDDISKNSGSGKQAYNRKRDAVHRLFENLGMDDEEYFEEDHLGHFEGRTFDSQEMTANLIDYMDKDTDPYDEDGFSGVESESLKDEVFANTNMSRLEELTRIPGFTPRRVARLLPFVTIKGNRVININVAKTEVIEALHPDIDEAMAESIYNYVRGEKPAQNSTDLKENIPGFSDTLASEISSLVKYNSRMFEVIGKVEYGNSRYFARGYLVKGSSGLEEIPELTDLQIY